ncbi:MAG TPA: amidohydrolase family protein [Xanthobacteraceae bacterium]|nr:amidohydrolase family protein [Xanthobacteraceae bacterium]
MTSGRIDTHHHIYPPKYLTAAHDQIARATHVHFPRISAWTPEQSLVAMDRDGITTSIVSISPSLWFGDLAATRRIAREWNEYAADLARDHRGRFAVFAALPLPDVEASLREIEHALDALGAVGFGLVTNYGDKWPGDKAFAPVFDELNRRKAVVYFHPTDSPAFDGILPDVPSPMIEFPFDSTRAIVSLLFGGTFTRCADIRWIFSHGGGALPMLAARIAGIAKNRTDLSARVPNGVLLELKKLYYDIAGVVDPIPFNAIRSLVGSSHLLFGTDYPFWSPSVAVKVLDDLGIASAERENIERGNALKLIPHLALPSS